jgi:hypothetical protein
MASVNEKVIGRCGNCGGEVTVPLSFMSTMKPVPTCNQCGSTAKTAGPVIPMNPRATSIRQVTQGDAGHGARRKDAAP